MFLQHCLMRRTLCVSIVALILISFLLSVKAVDHRPDFNLLRPTQQAGLGPFTDAQEDGSMSSNGMLKRLSTIAGQLPLYFSSLMLGKGSRQEPQLDLLTATACELQERLENGTTTSEALVRMYLQQINKHNINGMGLRAMVSLRSEEELLSLARDLDAERLSPQGSRGPLHGIPVIVKVTKSSSES